MPAAKAPVVLDAANLKKAMRHLAKVDPDFARAIKEVGHPELRVVPSGFGGADALDRGPAGLGPCRALDLGSGSRPRHPRWSRPSSWR